MNNARLISNEYTAKNLTADDILIFACRSTLWLGFCEDYKRVVINVRHELILIRAHNNNYLVRDPAAELMLEPK